MIADRLHLYLYSEAVSTMFSYLHGMRPNNRRTALSSPTNTHRSTVPPRHHHDTPPYSAQSPDGSVPYPFHSEADLSVPSPVSPVPPVLPPIPRFASPHELQKMVEGHGLYIYEKSPAVGQTFDKKEEKREGPNGPMSSSTIADDGHVATSENNARSETSSPQIEQQAMTLFSSEDQAQDERARPSRSPFSRINSSFEIFQNSSRPRSLENFAFIPQPQRPPPPLPFTPLQTAKPASSQPRHTKTKLHILNPMSLLARRRASRAPAETGSEKRLHMKSPSIPGVNLPDDYDPRIRGKVVHDFSAPRSSRSFSSNDLNLSSADFFRRHDSQGLNQHRLSPNPNSVQGESPNGIEREHTPIFKEHFEDDLGLDQTSCDMSDKQRSSAFMYQVSFQEPDVEPDSTSLPPFARNLQNRLSKAAESAYPVSLNPPLEMVLESTLVECPSHENFVKASPPISPPKARSRASSKAESIVQPNGFPKRLKSNASRFSFDLAGVGSSAQEKLLEEKHRQKAKQKLRESDMSGMSNATDDQNPAHEEYSASEYDDMDSDDGLEEKIPGVNADSGDAFFPMSRQTMGNSQRSLSIETSFQDPTRTGLPPKIANNNLYQHSGPALQFLTNQVAIDSSLPSLTVHGPEFRPQSGDDRHFGTHGYPVEPANGPPPELAGLPPRRTDEEDDLYFDDGIIDDLEDRDDQVFDESLFDDESSRVYGVPLRDPKKPPATQLQDRDDMPEDNSFSIPAAGNSNAGRDLSRVDSRDSFMEYYRDSHPTLNQAASLTKDNLEAYHDALAFAANQAALNGEFNRRKSLGPSGQDEAVNDVDSEPGMTPDDGRTSGEINGHFYGQGIDDPEGFDFDDALSDDPIIAAANAEALENDDEGFYGQEFGFFARANGPAEYANGGYFGPPGTNGIGRSHSGRANFQEPSLTPITERSEWSHRNSAISLAIHGYPPSMDPALASPGLAHLTDMIPREEDNMSLSVLMKLRRSAWGDSNTSLHSSGSQSQISGSPLNNVHTFPRLPSATSSKHQLPFSSTFSLGDSSGMNSSDSSDTSPSSPTITLATTIPPTTAPAASFSPKTDTRQLSPQLSRPGAVKGHSRANSGAESVSYVHERDEEGDRWVVEKRRMVDGGKVEVLGREVLQGAMI